MSKNVIRIMVMVMLVAASGCITSRQGVDMETVPAYNCRQAVGKIIIDGKLDDPGWKQAERIENFYPYRPEDAETISPITAWIVRDDNYLYVAIECDDDDIWSYSDQADDELWRGDVVEFFVKLGASTLSYCEFVMAPNGTLYDARYPSRGAGGFYRFKDWSSNAKVATAINGSDGDWRDKDSGYIVEMAIPFSAFSDVVKTPVAGDVWSFGVFRYDYSKSFEEKLLIMSIPESKENGFHYYEGYTPLMF